MTPDSIDPLSDLIASLAADAARAQLIFDQADADERKRFAAMLAELPEEARRDLLPLAPSRMRIGRMEIDCRVRVMAERRLGLFIGAAALNLGFDLRYGRSEASESRVTVVVEQTPAATRKE